MGLDWRKARPPKPTEDAIGEGFKRNDGTVTPVLPKGSLAKRAVAAERRWMAENGFTLNKGYIVKPRPVKR
jgi:hypothetical protein